MTLPGLEFSKKTELALCPSPIIHIKNRLSVAIASIQDAEISASLIHREARHAKHMRQKIPSPRPVPTSPEGQINHPRKRSNSFGLMAYACSESVAPSSRSSNGSTIIVLQYYSRNMVIFDNIIIK
jgi:hypothetical protein